jgi:hypothetical protein
MSNSQSFKNIKIPYPTEGIIRTASIDDTVAPSGSVQVAINANFDRVGGIQTRLGITEYADDLVDPIKQFGTLYNNVVAEGYNNLSKLAETTSLGEFNAQYALSKIDDTHYLAFWEGTGSDGFAQVLEVDLQTGAITPLGTAITFEAGTNSQNSCQKIDSTHYINVWKGTSGDGFAQVFSVNLTSWAVAAVGSPLEFDTADDFFNSLTQIDANHFLNCYSSVGTDGIAQVLEVNLTTYAVTAVGTPLTFDSTSASYITSAPLGDTNHTIVFWTDTDTDGKARVLNVNTGTWEVTTAGALLEFDTSDAVYNSCASLNDGQHFINFWKGVSGDGFAQVFEVNLSTFAITAKDSPFEYDTDNSTGNKTVAVGADDLHFFTIWQSNNSDVVGRVFAVDGTTFAVSYSTSEVTIADISSADFAVIQTTDYKILTLWSTTNTEPGPMDGSVFFVYGDTESHRWLYAQQGDGDVLNWDGATWTTRRTGVNPQQKARFTQYLNYIWMVNGNASFGDPVQTSNGGTFGTDLVPADFPPGDYIQAGFEGRVWVADKLYDVVYFTDIVQFTPPDLYTLTFDPATNFIKNFSPQNGQTITGLFTTPRALLLFKQDSIYRIYGAFSVDSYPAYNVGTYSQESIVQTKDGLYFHHSSGFYKFAYDSQPVEISRRVIDFVQAISRDYYPEVKGIYNGFDAVEWHVGSLTVEGVYYQNCVMRYTISTQVWTIYDYHKNNITALVNYDDGVTINMIVGSTKV